MTILRAGNQEITENDAKEVFMIEVPIGPISPERRGHLPQEMQALCEGLKIELVESLEVTKVMIILWLFRNKTLWKPYSRMNMNRKVLLL